MFPIPGDDKKRTHIAHSDFEALGIGIDAEMRSIEVLGQLIASEKKMDVRMIFNHLLVQELSRASTVINILLVHSWNMPTAFKRMQRSTPETREDPCLDLRDS